MSAPRIARETIVLKPKRLKLFVLLCFSMAFCLASALMIIHGEAFGWFGAISNIDGVPPDELADIMNDFKARRDTCK